MPSCPCSLRRAKFPQPYKVNHGLFKSSCSIRAAAFLWQSRKKPTPIDDGRINGIWRCSKCCTRKRGNPDDTRELEQIISVYDSSLRSSSSFTTSTPSSANIGRIANRQPAAAVCRSLHNRKPGLHFWNPGKKVLFFACLFDREAGHQLRSIPFLRLITPPPRHSRQRSLRRALRQ